MKANASLFLLAGLLLQGCGKGDPAPSGQTNTASSGNPLTAPADYIAAAARAERSASKTVSGVALDLAIQLYSAQEGKFPGDLNQLVPAYLPNIPPPPAGMKYSYDPKSGVVKVEPK